MPCQYRKGSESSPLRDPARASDTDSAALEVCDASVGARTIHFTAQASLDHETCDRAHRRERNGFHHGLLETFDLPVATLAASLMLAIETLRVMNRKNAPKVPKTQRNFFCVSARSHTFSRMWMWVVSFTNWRC